MSKITELIQEFCPNGIEFRSLGDVCEVADNKRRPVKASLRKSGDTPYYGANNIQDYVEGFTHIGEYVLLAEDGSASLENYSIQYTEGKFWANNHVHVVRGLGEVHNRFLFHFFKNMNFIPYLTGGTRAKLNKGRMLEIKIPIPPIEVQKEIVNILDKFTQLEAELSAELSARRRQYEYYRNQLLTFDDERVRWTTLEEVAVLKNGSDWKKLGTGDIPVYGTGGVMTTVSKFAYDKPTVLIPRKGSITNIFYLEEPFWNVDTIYYTEIDDEKIIPKFFYYYMKTIDLMKLDMGSGRPSLTQAILNKIRVPLPSLTEQNRIVTTLDSFDKLVHDISVGLPAELSARRQQYEYYRSKLLTFQETGA